MSTPTSTQLESVLQALKTYELGSNRGDLLPIDEAIRTSLDDPARRLALEGQLLDVLDGASSLGQVYLLRQLALIGSARAVATIADRLFHPELFDAACRTLEALPGRETGDALRQRLPRLAGNARLGAIQVLGRIRDAASVKPLAELLGNEDATAAGVAAAALGRIGSANAGRALADYWPNASEVQRKNLSHAVRDCADRLAQAGQTEAANTLLKTLG